ncbi:MAG TPA: hypothetical protein VFZ52_24200 [Chryseolinea sp.]
MKNVALICLILAGLLGNKLLAQPSETVAKEKMKPFAHWAGHWQGHGSTRMGPGPAKNSTVDESIEFKLDGAVLLIEGIGKSVEGNENKVVHHALAVLSFDQTTNQYKINTYLKDGRGTLAWFKIIEDNKYQWGFDTSNGKIKYSITLDPLTNTWTETGEFSSDHGATWINFFEMTLTKA